MGSNPAGCTIFSATQKRRLAAGVSVSAFDSGQIADAGELRGFFPEAIGNNRGLSPIVLDFRHMDYKGAFQSAKPGDLIYCDPPYVHSQSILYKGQDFSFVELLDQVAEAKRRGIYVAVSIDGTKKSGEVTCELPIPEGLFAREVFVNLGRSMLRRFQMEGETLENELVSDRLLLTY